MCPWAAGGGTDRIARQIAVLLERDLGVPINVVNVTGGDGVTGHSRGALARADGHTLTLVTVEIASLHWRGMTNISPDDYAPVGLVNEDAAAVFVRADAPWRTLADLEQAIREKPRTLRASGTAAGGIWHLALAGWLSTIGLKPTDVIWVSIAGSAPSFQELLAGGVDVVTTSLPEALALLSGGRVRALGVMAGARAAAIPRRANPEGNGGGLGARHHSRGRGAEGYACGPRRPARGSTETGGGRRRVSAVHAQRRLYALL